MTAPLWPSSPLGSLGVIADRRRSDERRMAERRRSTLGDGADRRRGADRRHGIERRESSGGHVRNAIQLLEFAAQRPLPDEERAELVAVWRRLWLALWEIERGRAPRPRR